MKEVKPRVFLVGETRIIPEGMQSYLEHIGAPHWDSNAQSDAEKLTEFYGKLCYKSFAIGLNPNIRKVRESNKEYIDHVIEVGHGSVMEHAVINFAFADVSRVFTHELVRHRAGVAISQESLRFVRLTDLGFWAPTIIRESPEAMATAIGWSGNIRAIRHVLEMRTDPAAEEEIRIVFGQVGRLMQERYPNLFRDYTVTDVGGHPHFCTAHRKV
ncbi:MAG: Thymidylate synthase complementing protein ThyX [Parcubacteria group bacterium GW2011_GWC1_51_35]|nr:MAG: Thymidylate synthase complementing protein ThyX [Parcubacteria group bacterium GW2011_GWC1_51_35]